MADGDLRSLERDASDGDPEARARFLRQSCRVNGHSWNHYKGGEHLCEVCAAAAPPDEREPGAQTMYTSISPRAIRRLMAEELRRMGERPDGAD